MQVQRTKVKPKKPVLTYATSPKIEALFAELSTTPDDGAMLVLADALAELGDVRAELAQVQRALAKSPRDRTLVTREAALVRNLRERLLGPKYAPSPEIAIETRYGFVRELVLTNQSERDATAILLHALPSPEARLLESLQLAWDEEMPMGLGEVFGELAGKVAMPPSLRRLKVGNAFERDTGDRLVEQQYDDDGELDDGPPENLKSVLTCFPRLTELVLDLGVVGATLAPLATKNLEVLGLITPRLQERQLAPLARSVLPSLRRFELWIGGTSEPNEDGELGDDLTEPFSMRHVEPVFAMLDRCTKLEELALGHVPRLGKLLAVLDGHPLLARLHTLELSHLELEDAGEIIDLVHSLPKLQIRLDGVSAGPQTRNVLARRLGSRLRADWASEPLRLRYVTAQE